jgi:hypothetical protein
VPASWRSRAARTTWVHIKRAVRKASNFPTPFNGPSDGPVRDLDDYTLCCTSFSKAPASDAIVVSCFSFVARPARDFDAKPRLSSGYPTPAMSPPSPLYPYRPYASTALIFPLRRSFCCVTIASSTHVSMFPQRGRRTGAGAAFQPLAHFALLMRLHQSVLHSSTQQKVDIA